MRKGQVIADAWRKVLEMDMVQVSRDQMNFNWVRPLVLFLPGSSRAARA